MTKKVLLICFITSWFSSIAYGQVPDSIPAIPFQIKDYIYLHAMEDILRYRLWINPEFNLQDRIKSKKGGEQTQFNNYNDKIFTTPLKDGENLLLEITRWPKDAPKRNLYLITKKNNKFTRFNNKPWPLDRDTVSIADYDRFNKYYTNDDAFLVYYDGKDTYKNISGNFVQDWCTPDWFTFNKLPQIAAWYRLAQYNSQPPYSFKETSTDWILFFDKCDLIKNNPGAFIVVMSKKWYYTIFEIIYYSNKKEITGDANNENFYEIKFKRDYSKHWWPESYEDTKPKIRKLTKEDITGLNKYYGDVIYLFGDIDYSVFN